MKNNWIRALGAFFLLAGLVLGLAPAAALAQAPGPLDHVIVAPAAATLPAGGTQQFSAQGYDVSNVPIAGLTYYWGAVAGGGTITATGLFAAGNVAATYPTGIHAVALQGSIVKVGYASVTVTAVTPSLDHITIIPASATLAVGGTQQFSAQGYDANNVAISGLTYFWAAAGTGTITATGLFTAGNTPGTYTTGIQASAVQGSIARVGYASVTITSTAPVPLDRVKITPSSANVAVGGTRQFSAQGYDANNVAIPGLTYYWSVVVAGAGAITQAGLFTAGSAAGPYPNAVQAIAVQNSIVKFETASVTITAAPQAAALASGTKRLPLLVAASLRGIASEDFLGAQWTVKEDGATSIIKSIPGVVKAISNTSLTLLPNGQTQTVSFALTAALVLAKDGLKIDEKAVVVTVNDQTRLVLEVPIPSVVQSAPPGIRKQLDKLFDRFEDRFTPPGWDKGKKTGWDRDWDWDDDEDDDD